MVNDYLQYKSQLEAMGCDVKADEPMRNHTSFKIGGAADLFVTVKDNAGLSAVVALSNQNEIPLFVLGNGSNLLVSDKGIRGIVLKLGGEFVDIGFNPDGTIRCGTGASLSKLCSFALEHSLTGLEFAWGIPGSCGGAAFMNAGAYGGEMKNVVASCKHVNMQGEFGEFVGDELDFAYRHSIYGCGKYIITCINIKLEKGDKAQIQEKMDDLMNRRKAKQPLEFPSAGSIFKRPVGYFAGGLIEQCGLKGASVGGAMVSPKHAGFIVNTGGATCDDVLNLICEIQRRVKDETGVELECEVRKTGE